MKISFQLPAETIVLDVALLDNPAVKSWADHFLHRNLPVKAELTFCINQHSPRPWNNNAKKKYTRLQELISILHKIGLIFDYPQPNCAEEITRDYLNKAHRFFTKNQKYVNLNNIEFPNHLEVTDYLQELNDIIHELEPNLEINAKTLLSDNFKNNWREIMLLHETAYDDKNWWTMEDSFRNYHSAEFANLILGPQILGKTLIQSFLDQDDPNNWDTSGHYVNNGYLMLMNKPYRQELYNSDAFKNWLSKHGVTPDQMYYDFPIGNVINQPDLEKIFQYMLSSQTTFPVQYSL